MPKTNMSFDPNLDGSRLGTSQKTRAKAPESTMALMARHLILVIACSPSCASARRACLRHPCGGYGTCACGLARGGSACAISHMSLLGARMPHYSLWSHIELGK